MNRFKFWTYVLLMAAPSACLFSCGDDDNGNDDPDNNGGGTETPSGDESSVAIMSSYQQKQKMEKVAIEAMNLMPSSDFKNIKDLAEYIDETYDNYDTDDVEDWAEEAFDALKKYTGQSEESYNSGWYIYRYVYTNYDLLVALSNFTGHFTANTSTRSWDYSKANDLQFIFKDKAGKQCVMKLASSGNTKDVHIGTIEDWDDNSYKEGVFEEYKNRFNTTVKVPEHINLSLSQGGDVVINADVNINIKSLDGKEFNLAKNSLNVSAKINLNNGYEYDLKQMAYEGNKSVSSESSIKVKGVNLMTINLSTDISGVPSISIKDIVEEEVDDDDIELGLKNAYMSVNIMGQVQLKGKISDLNKYLEYLEKADDNDDNESKFKSYLSQANGLADIYVYYDNKSTKQAKFGMEAFEEMDYSYRYWKEDPVFYFFDGSTSAVSFETFFSADDFKKAVEQFDELVDGYKELLGIEDDEDVYYTIQPERELILEESSTFNL